MSRLKGLTAGKGCLSDEELQSLKLGAIDAVQRKIRLKQRNKKPGKRKK